MDINENLVKYFKENKTLKTYCGVEMAIEHETMRIKDDRISKNPHPKVFGPKLKNKYITTDFAESQMELITPVFTDVNALYDFSTTLFDIANLELEKEEFLLAYSIPPVIESDDEIVPAVFEDTPEGVSAMNYRKRLVEIYGKRKQTFSGIHFNFSFRPEFIEHFLDKNSVYMKIARNYNKYKFLTVALLSATPSLHKSFFGKDIDKMTSIRNSELGYRNLNKLNINYNSVDEFITSVEDEIKNGKIYDEREIYSAIRIKTKSKNLLRDLKEDTIRYVELRNIDLNPYERCGISKDGISFLNALVLYCLVKETKYEYDVDYVSDFVAKTYDYDTIIDDLGISINELIINTLEDMESTLSGLICNTSIVSKYLMEVKNGQFLYKKVQEDIEKFGYENFILNVSKEHKTESHNNRFRFFGYEDMELSTQILMREAIKNGIDIDVYDKKDNFIKLSKGDRKEYIKQATKTSLDDYATVCKMENKVVTKKVLSENNIKVPLGNDFTDKESAINYAKELKNNFVIKPKSTNFGLGINIFINDAEETDIISAIDIAFSYDDTVIVEEYISGNEYRFLVIGDECVGVLNRVPANVIGDGKKSIKELVDIKNTDKLRGHGYKTPLEIIEIDENALLFLKGQQKDENYIPKVDEIVYLRQNSNISTGGDSIDYTDDMPKFYKDIAVEASKAIGAVISGVDIIISDYTKIDSEYAIIELNFNPAIHIHSFPYKGVERNIANKILQQLKLI